MGHLNMAAVRLAGDEAIRNLNSSLEVFYSEISVQFDRRLDTSNIGEVNESRADWHLQKVHLQIDK